MGVTKETRDEIIKMFDEGMEKLISNISSDIGLSEAIVTDIASNYVKSCILEYVKSCMNMEES